MLSNTSMHARTLYFPLISLARQFNATWRMIAFRAFLNLSMLQVRRGGTLTWQFSVFEL